MKTFTTPTITLLALGAALLCAPRAQATNTIYLETGSQTGGNNPYQYENAGEFTAYTSNSLVPSGYVAGVTTATGGANVPAGFGATGFETFCVADNVDFTVGQTYDYSISNLVAGPHGAKALTNGAAYLYQQFATGVLAGFDYSNVSARLTDAGELQAAIWTLQDGGLPAGFTAPSGPNVYLLNANAYLGATATASAAAGAYGVQVLNLSKNGVVAQDQLVYTASVPDTGTTLTLVGLAFLALALLRRRQSGRAIARV